MKKPDYTRTCEGCADVIKSEGAGGVTLLACGAEGRWKGATVCNLKGLGAGMYLPYVPAWCPKMK